jgi:Fe-S-cluster-containing hydrogenase component 2
MVKLNAKVNDGICLSCGGCVSVCPKDAILMCNQKAIVIENKCICCGICIKTCPIGAIYEED